MTRATSPMTMNSSVKYAKPRLTVFRNDGDEVNPNPVKTACPLDAGLKKPPTWLAT